MAITTTILSSNNPTSLIDVVNNALAFLTTSCIRKLELLAPGSPRYTSGGEWQVALTTEDGVKTGNPFAVYIAPAMSPNAAVALAQVFITAHPTYFFSSVTIVDLSEGSRSATKAVAMVVYNTVMSDGVAKYGVAADGLSAANFSGYWTQATTSGPTAITGLLFDSGIYRGMVIDYGITRNNRAKLCAGCVVCGDAAAPTITDPATTVLATGSPGGTLTVTAALGIVQVNMQTDACDAANLNMRWTARRLLLP